MKRNILLNRFQIKRLYVRNSSGQTLAEYALILAFISVVAIAALMSMGGQVSTVYTGVNRQLNTAANGGVTTAARTH